MGGRGIVEVAVVVVVVREILHESRWRCMKLRGCRG